MNNTLKIGELAKETGCLVETIRYYEREGLLLETIDSIQTFTSNAFNLFGTAVR
jgi:DNA-binding transcriptional MerR regulator